MVFPCSGTLQLVVTISRFLSSANIDEYDHDLCVWLLRGTQGHMIRHITVTKVCDVRIVPESKSPRNSINVDTIIGLIKFNKNELPYGVYLSGQNGPYSGKTKNCINLCEFMKLIYVQ